MTIEQDYIDLINAEIDGEISAEDKAALDAYVAGNEAAKTLREELSLLRQELDAVPPLQPPPGIRDSVLRQIHSRTPSRESRRPGMFADFLGLPVVRYGFSFAAGVVLAVALMSSDQASRHAFNDVADLVGTMSDIEIGSTFSRADSMDLTLNELAGSVSLKASGPLMVLDFDLTSEDPVEIIATFDNRDIWFNGFAQLESRGTSVAAGTGSVTVRMEGQRRYAVYLHNASGDPATVSLRFVAAGETLHEGTLRFGDRIR